MITRELTSLLTAVCGQNVEWQVDESGNGSLACGDRQIPIRKGIPRFIGDETYVESFGYQWNRFDVLRQEEDDAVFAVKVGVEPKQLAGLLVLDAGCGGGRYSRVAARHGARVVGVDRSQAVDKASELLSDQKNWMLLQADLNELPLPEATFDLVFSIGVLHHSPDAHKAFLHLAKRVKPGGRLSVWLYRKNTWPQERINDGCRWLAARLSRKSLLGWSRVGATVGGVPIVGPLFSKIVNVSTHPDAEIRVCDTFDWYSPTYQSHHTPAEVRDWFQAAGFGQITELPPAKSGRLYRSAFARGWIPGSGVNVTGIRRPVV